MKLAAFLEALQKTGFDTNAEAVLDALWLASGPWSLGCGESLPVNAPKPGPVEPSRPGSAPPAPGPHAPAPEPGPDPSRPPDRPVDGQSGAFPNFTISPEDRTVPASPLRLPSARSLPQRLALTRALRPFRQRRPSPCEFELDEERSSELTAELRRFLSGSVFPVTVPRMERWYEAHLVIEDDASVEVWAAPLREFTQMLGENGAFRLIRTWRLRLDPTAPAELDRARLENPAGVVAPVRHLRGNPRRLIFFASHGASDHWLDGSYARLLASWSAASIALLHLLPRERWGRTALGEVHGSCRAEQAGASSNLLKIKAAWWRHGADPDDPATVRLPVTSLEPSRLAEWARMQMSRGRQAPVYLLDPSYSMKPATVDEEPLEVREIERRLVNLQEQSPRGYHLAMLLSAAPFTLPVARVIQETALGTATDYGLLADILLSGVVTARRLEEGGAEETAAFEIVPQARTILQRGLRKEDGMIVFRELERRVSEHLKAKTGQGISFEALRIDPKGQRSLPVWARHFAQVALALAPPRAEPGPLDLSALLHRLEPKVLARLARYVRGGLGPPAMSQQTWDILTESGAVTSDDTGRLAVHRALVDYLEARMTELPLLPTRLLWVDDRPRNNDLEIAELEELGLADYEQALTTEDALGRVDIGDFDIIISDMARPPEWEAGLDLIAGLRGHNIDTSVIIYAGDFASRDRNRRRVEEAGGFGCTNDPSELVPLVLEAADLAERIARKRIEAADADNRARLAAVRSRLISLLRARAAADATPDSGALRLANLLSAMGLDDFRVGELASSAPAEFVSRWAGLDRSETEELPDRVLCFLDTITEAGYAQLFEISSPSEDGEKRIELIAERIPQGLARYRLASWDGVIGRAATRSFVWVPDVTLDRRYIRAESSTRSELAAMLHLKGFRPLVVNLEFRLRHALGSEEVAWLGDLFEALRDANPAGYPAVAGPSVLLARVTDDLEERRRRLRSHLEQFEIDVVLAQNEDEVQKEGIDFAEAFQRQLETKPIVVQLLGPVPAPRTADFPDGFDGLQARLAQAHRSVQLYQWRDPNLKVDAIGDRQHRALIERAYAMLFEAFKEMVTRRAVAARAPPEPDWDRASDPFVIIDADPADELAAREVLGECSRRGIRAWMPEFGSEKSVDWMVKNLAEATGLVLIHINGERPWLRARFNLFMKASVASRRPLRCLIYVSGPALRAGGGQIIHAPLLEVVEAPDGNFVPLLDRLEQWSF